MKTSDLLQFHFLTKVGAIGSLIGNMPAAPENAALETLNVHLPGFLMSAA